MSRGGACVQPVSFSFSVAVACVVSVSVSFFQVLLLKDFTAKASAHVSCCETSCLYKTQIHHKPLISPPSVTSDESTGQLGEQLNQMVYVQYRLSISFSFC